MQTLPVADEWWRWEHHRCSIALHMMQRGRQRSADPLAVARFSCRSGFYRDEQLAWPSRPTPPATTPDAGRGPRSALSCGGTGAKDATVLRVTVSMTCPPVKASPCSDGLRLDVAASVTVTRAQMTSTQRRRCLSHTTLTDFGHRVVNPWPASVADQRRWPCGRCD